MIKNLLELEQENVELRKDLLELRLHGVNLITCINELECIRPFIDADFVQTSKKLEAALEAQVNVKRFKEIIDKNQEYLQKFEKARIDEREMIKYRIDTYRSEIMKDIIK